MRTRGRPTKLTPEVQAKVVEALRAGNYIETAAAFAGLSKVTLYDWLKRGAREPSGPHRDFLSAVEKAMADAEVRDVALIAKAGQQQWQAAAWRLERRFPERWGKKERHEVTGANGGPVAVASLQGLSDEELDRMEATLEALGRSM